MMVPYHNQRDAIEPDLFRELAVIWLKKQDLKDKSPEDVHTMFWDAYYHIRNDYEEKINQNVFDAYV